MSKKLISIIFMYILLTGCDTVIDGIVGPDYDCEECYLEISAPDLVVDENGFYTMTYNNTDYQTFSTLKAETGSTSEYQYLAWTSNKEFGVEWQGQMIWTNLVNGSSYTDGNGEAFTVLGVYSNFIGDTIKVYCGYEDNENIHYLDSLEVIVK